MKKYKRVELKKVSGFKYAERLKLNGWHIIAVGFDYILMERGSK